MIRIDFDTLVLSGPSTATSTPAITDSPFVGDCMVDSLTGRVGFCFCMV